ncbi:uncharacterized protein LOC132126389 [Carassius carassius]|uniref:uncharacterized protein LOC132126370 n=1 Tax=Carassius carassius TaxID=217509 RepID=UPI0028687DEF|nr:uncharacterized protein LOC132126370 [Carassius carassius]XP_059393576.1 uncharacterized protein LOC132126378 [Carassius carassius]XP_059393577.1 uncharacterized protein LOC132126379 [Carassius carassius]XP_059393591.1 uncharacterized protein LOC132126389 [Carassius carassius]
MSKRLQLSHDGHDECDEDIRPYTRQFNHGHGENSEELDMLSTKQWQKDGINEIDEATIKKSEVQNTKSLLGMIDTYDRPASASAEGGYAEQDLYASGFENKPGKRLPKAGYLAEAGVGRARAEYSVFEAEAKGPSASFDAEAKLGKLGAMARAEIASASAKAGPIGVKVGLGFDTGASIGVGGMEAKILGIGFSFGSKMGLSFLGSEVSFSFL